MFGIGCGVIISAIWASLVYLVLFSTGHPEDVEPSMSEANTDESSRRRDESSVRHSDDEDDYSDMPHLETMIAEDEEDEVKDIDEDTVGDVIDLGDTRPTEK